MKTKTNREVATNIARQGWGLPATEQVKLRDAIEAALDAERERCEKIADSEAQLAARDEALSNDDADRGRCYAAMKIAAEIRGTQ